MSNQPLRNGTLISLVAASHMANAWTTPSEGLRLPRGNCKSGTPGKKNRREKRKSQKQARRKSRG